MKQRSLVVELQRLAIRYVVFTCLAIYVMVFVRLGAVNLPGTDYIDMSGLYSRTEIYTGDEP